MYTKEHFSIKTAKIYVCAQLGEVNGMFKRFLGLFQSKEDYEQEQADEYGQKTIVRNVQQNINAKVIYKYPKQTPFRFPVIPDEIPKRHNSEVIKAQAGEQGRNDQGRSERTRRKDDRSKKGRKQPFVPTRVPSPIYGYRREITSEIEETPAFLRKQKNATVEASQEIKTKERETIVKESPLYTEEQSVPKTGQKAIKEKIKQPIKVEKIIEHQIDFHAESNTPLLDFENKEVYYDKNTGESTAENYFVPLHLLNDPVHKNSEDLEWVEEQKELLEKTLSHFNVNAKVVNATQGPSVTRFEVQPELGVKVSRVRNLSDDIKMNMAAKDIRIEAPIPGKNTIGIEVPNKNAQTVGLQEIIEDNQFINHPSKLSIGLGLTLEGDSYITTIDKMPHGLIAGATGSGKSVCINSIILSLLYKASHEEIKLLLIDPKMVELAPYNGVPHLIAPVITDVKAATAALKWAVNEMEERYEKFAKSRVRDIHRYNEKAIASGDEKMAHIVIIIDELADLMMVSPQDVEDAICRIAQKARACGMHLLIATQRPSVDVITGLIKANIPTRIAFSVSSQVDSRTIIDTNGAERLLGKGDMLFSENGSGNLIRLQGAFVSDEEIERITNYVRNIAEPNYLFEQDELLEQIDFDDEVDELFEDVVQFILEYEQASTSLLQRHFRIGYNRAARIIDTLEERGMISEQRGSKPREVLFTIDQLDEYL